VFTASSRVSGGGSERSERLKNLNSEPISGKAILNTSTSAPETVSATLTISIFS
jgi:hypothetical protein